MSLVRENAVAADIGADHGLLICRLVASGKCPRGLACDVNPLPLESSRKEIQRQGLQERISTVLTDGLDGLESRGISDFLILGMGGDLIGEIVTRHSWAKDGLLRFVLQPMTKAEKLRKILYRSGFAIAEEKAVRSGRFVYSVMAVSYTGEAREVDELFAWTGLIAQGGGADARAYLRNVADRVKKKAAGLAVSGSDLGETEGCRLLASQIGDLAI